MSAQNVKVQNIVNCINKNGVVDIRLDGYAGVRNIRITKKGDNRYIVGRQPGAEIKAINERELTALINSLRMYVAGVK